MSWRRALIRVWALFPLIWAGYFGYDGGLVMFQAPRPNLAPLFALTEVGIAISVPALLEALGYVVAWIVRGLKLA